MVTKNISRIKITIYWLKHQFCQTNLMEKHRPCEKTTDKAVWLFMFILLNQGLLTNSRFTDIQQEAGLRRCTRVKYTQRHTNQQTALTWLFILNFGLTQCTGFSQTVIHYGKILCNLNKLHVTNPSLKIRKNWIGPQRLPLPVSVTCVWAAAVTFILYQSLTNRK